MPADRPEVFQWALEEFGTGIASVFELMAAARPEYSCEVLSAMPAFTGVTFGWSQPLTSLPGEAFLAVSEQEVLNAGNHVMLAAGVDNASDDEKKSTFLESVGQGFSILGRAITTRLQREVVPEKGQQSGEPPADALWGSVRLTLGAEQVTLYLGLPAKMLEALEPGPKVAAQAAGAGATPTPASPVASAPLAPPPPPPPASVNNSQTFDLLLDVELPVSVSFGHAFVPLKEVLKLTTGSIVELSRAIIEPVDVVVNNCVIAKGEVVVVEGNFGVRIQHVISRSERLRTLQ
ncbi:MAG: FliM/FliN family flagellar motor switch protein [Acidobacteriota bacterium]